MSLSEDWSAEIAIPRSDPRWVAELSESSNYAILIKFSYWVTCDRLEQTCAKFHERSLKTVAVSTKKCNSLSEDWYCESTGSYNELLTEQPVDTGMYGQQRPVSSSPQI